MSLLSFCGYAQLAPECFEDPDFEMVPAADGTATDWLTLDNGIGMTYIWTQQVHTEGLLPSFEGTAGTHAAYIARETVGPGDLAIDYLVTPEFNLPPGAQLKFQSRLTQAGDQGGTYKVMILPDGSEADDITNYVLVEDWTELEINPSQLVYNEITLTLPAEYENTTVRVAFVMEGNNDDRWLVDCVSVTEPCLEPSGLAAENMGLDTAELSWDNPSGATTWEIEIIASGGVPTGYGIEYTGTLPYVATGTASGSPLVQTPFEPNTEYKFYVRAICDDGGESEWVGAFFFETVGLGDTCNAPLEIAGADLPYSTTDDTANYADEYEGVPGGCGSTGSYLNGNDVVYEFTPDFTGTISIDFIDNGSYSGIWVYEECDDIGTDCFEGGEGGFEGNPVYLEFEVTEGEDYYIVISTWAAPQTTPYTMIIQQVFCDKPENLSATNIGMTTAELLWDNPGGATSWEVEVGPAGDPIPSGAGEYTVTTNTGWDVPDGVLGASTAYQYYVRADCGDGTFSAWAGPYYFNTAICEVGDQCEYTFEMWAQWDGTWNGHTMNVVQNGIVVAVLEGPTTWGMGTVTQTVQLCEGYSFELFWNANANWAGDVGISITNNHDQEFYIKNPGTGSPGTSLYTLEEIDCENPLCLPPAGLYTDNSTMTTIDLGWEGPATGEWEYYIVEAGGDAPTDDTSGTPTTTNPTVGAGAEYDLQEATNYEFYVRMVCEDAATDFSPWAGPYAFATAVCDTGKCTWTFVMTDSYGDGWNGNTMTVMQGGVPVGTFGAEFTDGNGPVEATMELCHGFPVELHWNSGGSFAYEVGVTVLNSFDQNLYSKPAGTGSQGTLLWEGEVDCETPLCLPPTGLYTENATMNTVDLGWDGQPTGTWEYYIVEAGDPAPGDDTSGTPTTNNPTTDVPLDAPATNYEFYVRMVCEDAATDFSEWAGPFAFNSEVCDPADKCVYNFVMTSAMGWGAGNNTFTITQAGVPVATIGGNWWGYEMSYEIALCPDEEIAVTWNAEGWDINDKGLIIYTPFLEDVYVMEPGSETPGTVVFQEAISCDPPPCPKPQNLEVTDITTTQVTFNWDEMGSATQWTVWVLPYGSADPLPDSTEGAYVVTEEPFIFGDDAGEVLEPGTPYVFYAMAMCGEENGNSTISGPITFVTALLNDDCEGAIEVPVNSGVECDQTVTGTFTGGTFSGIQPSCYTWGEPASDVWFTFEATAANNAISLLNVTNNIYPSIAVYEGDECGDLTEIYCGYGTSAAFEDLVPGTTYYVNVYLEYFNDPAAVTSFDICVRIPTGPISVNDTEYTVEELVTEVLLNSQCAQVSNVTWVSGSDFGQSNSIGYFNKNGSNFPFNDGIILANSGIVEAPGPYPGTPTFDDQSAWPDDEDLTALIAPGGWTDPSYNATVLEFDFVPLADQISFDFLFASDEYGTFQCGYSDAFAFLLTHPDGTVENLAVVPDTTIPVSVVTIRDNEWNPNCDSQNEQYFDQYNPADPLASSISYNGQTVIMAASADVQPGETYHIKLVIQDYLDGSYNSAVFLGGGSFDIGDVDLGLDLTEENNNAVCNGAAAVLDTNLDEDIYNFEWFYDEDPNDGVDPVIIEGETGPTLTVEQNADGSGSGQYSVEATYEGTDCAKKGDVLVEFYEDIEVEAGIPNDLEICDSSGFATFDLSQNTEIILSGDGIEDPADYTVTYHISQEDAENDEGALDLMHTNVAEGGEVIYVRIEHIAGCVGYTSFQITVTESTAVIAINDDFSICEGTSGTITATVTNTEGDVTYTWTHDGEPMADTANSIEVTEAGIYEVTVHEGECTASESVTVTVVPLPVVDEPADLTACGEYMLPALTSGDYYTGQGGTGDMLNAGDVITATQTIYVFAQTAADCTDESSFTVTIGTTPVVAFEDTCDDNNIYMVTVNPEETPEGEDTFNPDAVSYEWTGPNGFTSDARSIAPAELGMYNVTVTTAEGCVGTAEYEVISTVCLIQKGISPNGDGLNDSFDLSTMDVAEISIFNRYGQEVYSRSNYTNEWHGQGSNGDELPSGTYFYMIERSNGEQITGWIYVNMEE